MIFTDHTDCQTDQSCKKKNIPLPLQCDTNNHDNHKLPTNYCNNSLLLNQSQQEREPWANRKGK